MGRRGGVGVVCEVGRGSMGRQPGITFPAASLRRRWEWRTWLVWPAETQRGKPNGDATTRRWGGERWDGEGVGVVCEVGRGSMWREPGIPFPAASPRRRWKWRTWLVWPAETQLGKPNGDATTRRWGGGWWDGDVGLAWCVRSGVVRWGGNPGSRSPPRRCVAVGNGERGWSGQRRRSGGNPTATPRRGGWGGEWWDGEGELAWCVRSGVVRWGGNPESRSPPRRRVAVGNGERGWSGQRRRSGGNPTATPRRGGGEGNGGTERGSWRGV